MQQNEMAMWLPISYISLHASVDDVSVSIDVSLRQEARGNSSRWSLRLEDYLNIIATPGRGHRSHVHRPEHQCSQP